MNLAQIRNLTLWAVTCLVAVMFLFSGIPKFFDPGWVDRFARWDYAPWFVYLIAVSETLGAIGLLIPRTAAYAALGLVVIMLGAMYTHLAHGQGNRVIWNLVYVLLLGLIVAGRWHQRFIKSPLGQVRR